MSTDKIRQLEKQFETLNRQITAMEKLGQQNEQLNNLKKQRQQIKEQLAVLRRQSWIDSQTVNLDD